MAVVITVGERIAQAIESSRDAGGALVRLRWTEARARVLRSMADAVVHYDDGGLYAEGGADADGTVYHPWSVALGPRPTAR